MQRFAVLALVALLPACATVVDGTGDTVTLSTTPAGATCTVDRSGERVGAVAATPGSLRLSKSRHDLNITCTKEGYQPSTTTASSRFTGATFGNVLVGGVVGVVVDAASGANNRYPPDVRLDLAENPAAPPPAPVAQAPSPMVRPVGHQGLHGPGM
jgi:hypothetical protein